MNQKGFIMPLAIMVGAAVAIALFVYFFLETNKEGGSIINNLNESVNSNVSTNSVNKNDSTLTEADYDILYAYKREYPSTGEIYRASIDNDNKIKTNLPYDPSYIYHYYTHPDKDYLILLFRYKYENTISIIPKNDLFTIKEIVNIQDENVYAGSVVFIDNNRIAYSETTTTLEEENNYRSFIEQNIYLINIDGTNKTKIYSSSSSPISIKDYYNPETGEIYATDPGSGGCAGGLKTLNIHTGVIKNIENEIPDDLVCSVLFNKDFTKGYYIEDLHKIIEYNFIKNTKKTIFEIDLNKDETGSYNTYINKILLSPDYKSLVFTITNKEDDYLRSKLSYLLNIETNETNIILDKFPYSNLVPLSWSPDNKYIWFSTDSYGFVGDKYGAQKGTYILNIESGELKTYFIGEKNVCNERGEQCVNVNEQLFILGWLDNN